MKFFKREKVIVLAKELDQTEVHILIVEIKKIESLELANLKEAMRQVDWELYKKVIKEELIILEEISI